ncbi:putative polysaccharide biosynthesis protein [Pediococcus argentinicus]|uniref:putative polysaccharide biosynthesis protein n=1 Tax=Pediococcus argentinicus TaxID=480391 RepID=UPI00070AEABB|nr:polysaccharide biosynthesis protein [Pediococcus argentinicus]GEP19966.1 sugar transporter [Pediococcus argentinicus]
MQKRHGKNLIQGALVLSLASVIAKILSAVYRIPLQNLVGNTGFYVYQQIYPIYGIGMTFALSGFPVFISKLIAEAQDDVRQKQLAYQSMIVLAVFSVILFVITFLTAPFLATGMGDPGLAPIIKVVSFMFLFMPIIATGRGYYQGIYKMGPTATSQVVEQLVRVLVIIAVAYIAAKHHWNVYRMGKWAMASADFAAVAAMAFFVQFAVKLMRTVKLSFSWEQFKHLSRRFLTEGGLICLFAAMLILLQLVDSFTIKNNLVLSGIPDEAAKSIKGVYDRAQPLVQVGLVIATSFATTMLPSLTESIRARDSRMFYRTASSLIRVSLAVSMTASIGMIVLMPQINLLLFGSVEGTSALMLYNLCIIFAALIFVNNSILQSSGSITMTFWALSAGMVFKLIFNGVAVRHWGINGASIVTVLSLLIIWLVMMQAMPERLRFDALFNHQFLTKLVLGNVIMAGVVYGVAQVLGNASRANAGLTALVGAIIGAAVFVVYAIFGKLFTIREWLLVPYGKRILKKIQEMKK